MFNNNTSHTHLKNINKPLFPGQTKKQTNKNAHRQTDIPHIIIVELDIMTEILCRCPADDSYLGENTASRIFSLGPPRELLLFQKK